jgi:predicted transcriptional regulator
LEVIIIGKDFLDRTSTAQQLRESMDNWDFIKFKSFCTTKEIVSKLNRELKKVNSTKINEPIKKLATKLNRTISKEEIQKTHEKVLIISSHKGNENQNHTKILPHCC